MTMGGRIHENFFFFTVNSLRMDSVLSCWLEVWAKPENLASLLVPYTVKSQKSEIFTFCKTVKTRLFDQKILKSFTYLIRFSFDCCFRNV